MTKPHPCRYCGRTVEWRVSKTGNRYLAEELPIYNEDGRHIKTILPAHECRATEEEKQAVRNAEAERIQAGALVKGQTVIVHKGRKVPVGTIGTITWIAGEPDGYGVTKIRIVDANNDAHFLNIENVRAYRLEEVAS